MAHRLLVDLGDQRTGGVEIEEVARLRVIPCEEPCIGITYPEDVQIVRDALT